MYARQDTAPLLTAEHVSMSTNVPSNASAGTGAATTRPARSDASAYPGLLSATMEELVLMRFKTCVTRNTKKDTALYRDRIQSQDLSAVAVLVKVSI